MSASNNGHRKGWYPYLSRAPESFPPPELPGKPEDAEQTRAVGDREKGTYHVFPVRNQTQSSKKK